MTLDELAEELRRPGAKVIDTRGYFVAAAGPYLSPSLAGVPGEILDVARATMGLELCEGPLGLPAYRLPQAGYHRVDHPDGSYTETWEA